MKQVKITSTTLGEFGAKMDDPTSWIEQGIANNWWGKPERWLPDYLEGAETREIENRDGTFTIEYLHPCEYVITIEDYVKPNREIRAEEYKKRTDHLAVEAIRKYLLDPSCEEWAKYIDEINAIKMEFPD